jgi:rare lipoprotein A
MMKKYWLIFAGSAFLLAGCAQPLQPYAGKVQPLSGAHVYYEPFNPASMENYSANGNSYRIISNPVGYIEQGVAGWFDDSDQEKPTIIGEKISNYEFIGAHPRLPLPSYVSVTNMNNGRQLIVRLIARAPVKDGTVITLSKTAADRLMLTEQTPIQIDYVDVSPDGNVNGAQSNYVESVRQSYPLPTRPDIASQ